ncbi:MAG: aldose epimerase [Lactobacillus sp.]
MQTIDNSLFQVSVDENGARVAHLISVTDNFDYLASEAKEGMAIAFPVINHDNDWASKVPWTVVDKGDTRMSLTLIDTPESYKSFPYHFEVMTTYALEGNQVEVDFYLKNSSHKEMPFSLGFVVPNNWPREESINKINLNNGKHEIDVASTDFKLNAEENRVIAFTDEIKLEAESSKNFALSLTLK